MRNAWKGKDDKNYSLARSVFEYKLMNPAVISNNGFLIGIFLSKGRSCYSPIGESSAKIIQNINQNLAPWEAREKRWKIGESVVAERKIYYVRRSAGRYQVHSSVYFPWNEEESFSYVHATICQSHKTWLHNLQSFKRSKATSLWLLPL